MTNLKAQFDLPWSVSPMEDGVLISDNNDAPIISGIRQEEGVYIVTSCNLRPYLETSLKTLIDEAERIALAERENGRELTHLWRAINEARGWYRITEVPYIVDPCKHSEESATCVQCAYERRMDGQADRAAL